MLQARESHTATLLRSGLVLVAGGTDGTKLSTTELYNPATRTWSRGRPLNVARSNHTATLLEPSGKVLVAGGRGSDGAELASAEIYDPRTGAWTLVGPMKKARAAHSATLLNSGNVLVAGGDQYFAAYVTNTAEIFNPRTGEWVLTGAMSVGRNSFDPYGGAVRLCDGRVMFVGYDANAYDPSTGTAEIYDPSSGTWSTAGALPFALTQHSASLLPNCQVLVAGGLKVGVPFEESGTLETRTYNPSTNTWTRVGDLHQVRYAFNTGIVRSGVVVIVGGSGTSDLPVAAEAFDPRTKKWMEIAGTTPVRVFATLTRLHNGELLLAGGSFETYEASTRLLRLP